MVESLKEELPRGGHRKIAIGSLDQQNIAEIHAVAQIRQVVFRVILALDLRRQAEIHPRLTDVIECKISHRHFFFEFGSLADPVTQLLPKNYGVIAEPQQVGE